MKKTKIFTLTLLVALLAAGCSKSEQEEGAVTASQNQKNRLWIFANDMGRDGSKVSINPVNPNQAAQWITDEKVLVNGEVYKVAFDDQYQKYFLKDMSSDQPVMPLSEEMSALYPGASFDGNIIDIKNDKEIVMSQLEIAFLDGGRQAMAFPMIATASANSEALYFDHLSAGVQITIQNNGTQINLKRLTIIAQSNENVVNLGTNDDNIARWAVEGPWVPLGPVGHNDDEIDVKYSSVMNFVLSDKVSHTEFKTLGSDPVTFCVPITISKMKRLKVIGYDEHDAIVFYKTKGFFPDDDQEVDVERNKMYAFPKIVIENTPGE